MLSKGKLITLEGIDGTGKSTVARMLKKKFPEIVFTMEPTGGWIGKAVKKSIESDGDPLAELFLFTADHAEHIAKVIRPGLGNGNIVISDRYSDSRYAYQGATLGNIIEDAMGFVQDIHRGWTVVPDLTLLFNIDPNIAVLRCGIRGEKTKFERIELLKKVQENYMKLARDEPRRFVLIDAERELLIVEQEVESVIEDFIEL